MNTRVKREAEVILVLKTPCRQELKREYEVVDAVPDLMELRADARASTARFGGTSFDDLRVVDHQTATFGEIPAFGSAGDIGSATDIGRMGRVRQTEF